MVSLRYRRLWNLYVVSGYDVGNLWNRARTSITYFCGSNGSFRFIIRSGRSLGLSIWPDAGSTELFGSATDGLYQFFLLEMFHFDGQVQLVLLSFSAIMICWPFLIVSGTALTALLSPFGKGEGMGFFCSVLAAACFTGSAIGGWLAAQWG